MKKIIKLTESDLSRIIDRVLNETSKKRNVLSEISLNSDGTYSIKKIQEFIVHGQQYTGNPPRVYIKQDAIVKKNNDGKSVSVDVYYKKQDSKGNFSGSLVKAGVRGKYECGGLVLKLGEQWYYQHESSGRPFSKAMDRLFCNGSKLKSDKIIDGGGEEPKPKPKTDSRCKFVEKEFKNQEVCFLPDDKVWMYAKTDDGKWYTTKQTDKKTWCELTTPKFQKAIDILVAGCKGLQPVPELKIKKLEPIDTSTEDMVLKKTDQQKKEFEDKMKNLPQ